MYGSLPCDRRVTLHALTTVTDIATGLRLHTDQPLDVEEWANEDRSPEARATSAAYSRCFGDEQ